MAQGFSPEEQEEALTGVSDLLSNELMNISAAKQNESAVATHMMDQSLTPQRINNGLDAAYAQMAMAPGEFEVGRVNKGGRILATFGKTRQVDDPRTGEIVIIGQDQIVNRPAHSDYNVARQMMEDAEKPKTTLNIEAEMARINGLRGDERSQAASILSINIRKALAQEQGLIQKEAARKSGLAEAKAAYDINLMLDQQKGGIFATQPSHQTATAENLFNSATTRSKEYERMALTSSTRVAELTGWLEDLSKVQQRIATREERQDAVSAQKDIDFERNLELMRERSSLAGKLFEFKREWDLANGLLERNAASERQAKSFEEKNRIRQEKETILLSTVSDQQLTNYRLAYGRNEGDFQDRLNIVTARGKDTVMAQLLMADTSTIRDLLLSDNSQLKERAIKILNGYDILNAGKTELPTAQIFNAPDTALTKQIRKILSDTSTDRGAINLAKELKVYNQDALAARTNEVNLTSDAKSRERLRKNMINDIINATVNKFMEDSIKEDVRTWKANEMTGILKPILDGMRPLNKEGKVNISDFVEAVADAEIKDPISGQVLDKNQKINLIRNTIHASVQNAPKTILFPGSDQLASTLSASAANRINNRTLLNTLGLTTSVGEVAIRYIGAHTELLRTLGIGNGD